MAGITKVEIRNTSNQVVTKITYDPSNPSSGIDKTSTSINLFGKGVEVYLGEVNSNFYALLENFASKRAPLKPQVGQLWYAKKGSNLVEVRGTGLNYNAGRYLKINGVDKGIKNSRGIALVIFDNNFASSIKFTGYYDTYGSDGARTQLATKLGTLAESDMFVMVSYDAIGTNVALSKKMIAMGSQAWHKVKMNWRYPYTAIGTGKFGIISEDLKGFDEKKYAFAQVAFESLVPGEGMGPHTALSSTTAVNDNLLVWNGETWGSSAATIDGKDLVALRNYILSGVDLSTKYDKTGGTINGSVTFASTLTPKQDIVPTGNEIQDLGTNTNRFSKIHLSEENSIYMGPSIAFNKNSFVYTVEKEDESVTNVPPGSLILNRATGEAIVKKLDFVSSINNNTFRKLSLDKKYGVTIGGNNYSFSGDKGIWMGSWNHGVIQRITIPTPSNAVVFGNCRTGGHSAGCSDGTRGLSFHQHNYDAIQYITIATPMNAVDFGWYGGGWSSAAASDGTKALTFGGAYRNQVFFVLFSTPMSSAYFSDLGSTGRHSYWNAAVSDGNKAIFDSGANGWWDQTYFYINMSTPSNAIYFGKMQNSRGWTGAASNGTHALWAGGHEGWRGNINFVEKLALAAPGNSTHFGNLSYARHSTRPVANDTRMVASGGDSYSTIIDHLAFASGGSAVKFGDTPVGIRYPAAFSGN